MKNLTKLVIECRLSRMGAHNPKIPSYTFRGSDKRIPSKGDGVGVAPAAAEKVYTGDKMIGIATMHKSNAVPVFSQESATEISRMK